MVIKSIKIESFESRIFLIIFGLLGMVGVFFAFKWLLGNAISLQAANKNVAELAVRMAPSDPQPHYTLAVLNERTFLPEHIPIALSAYEKAAALSPNDYRWWVALGKAREQNGNASGAELAFKRAIEMSPNYAHVQWTYGNSLLRQGKTEKAFVEILKAARQHKKFTPPAVATIWQILDGDVKQVRKIIGNSNDLSSALAEFLAKQRRYDEALKVWNDLPENERRTTFKSNGENIYQYLLGDLRYRSALEVKSQIAESGTVKFNIASIHNGGFESDVNIKNPSLFEWEIGKGINPQINITNSYAKSGKRSLIITFNITNRKDFRTISQIIAVKSDKKYEFETFYKSELDAPETVKWEILDAKSKRLLASTDAAKRKTDWTRMEAIFNVSEDTEAIIIRIVREGCESAVCPLNGKIWFDDFSLK